MRSIFITREKHFSGCILQYFCVLDVSLPVFQLVMKQNGDRKQYASRTFPISNGKTIEILVDEAAHSLFIFAFTSNGIVYSKEINIGSGNNEHSYRIHAEYSMIKGLKYELVEEIKRMSCL